MTAVSRYRRMLAWTHARGARGVSRGLWVAGLAVAAGLIVLSPLGGGLEERLGLGVLFQLRGRVSAPPGVAIVAIDRASAAALDLADDLRRWPRTTHARLVDALSAGGASAIVFDVLFGDEGWAEEDAAFARALRAAGDVALLQGLERSLANGASPDNAASAVVVEATEDPSPQVGGAAAAVAPFPLPKVPDRVSRAWVFRPGTNLPTLPAVALQLAARDIATDWADLLATEPMLRAVAADWTDAEHSPGASGRLVRAMAELRRSFLRHPDIANRLAGRLDNANPALGARLRPLLALYRGEGTRVLDFRGPAGTILTVPYAALVAGTAAERAAAARAIAGRIVVVGDDERNDVRQTDAYHTVFSGENGIDLTGVEILATAIADLQEQSSLDASPLIGALAIIGVGILLGAAGAWANIWILGAVAVLLPLGVGAAGYAAFVGPHLVVPVAAPVLVQLPVALLATAWSLRSEEKRQRQTIAKAVRQYLPEPVARTLAQGPLVATTTPPSEIQYVVCMATDAEGFTTVSERLSPDRLGRLLNEYLDAIFSVVRRHGGVVANLAGDGMMCVWTLPASHAADAAALTLRYNAASAAIDILEAVAAFNRAHPVSQLPIRIGLHAGAALIGAVGGAGHYAATVVGDVANTASRLEALSKRLNTRLLASEEALQDVAGFAVRPLGHFLLAGKSQPVRTQEILGRRDAANPARFASLIVPFEAALSAYRKRQWDVAVEAFEVLLKEHPQDGPTAFFLERSRGFARSPPPPGSEILARIGPK